jgi:ubiquinone/menaquinone biosynthesis C-methylase UbiE
MDLHMDWIRSIEVYGPRIVDAGGGSGIMTAEAQRRRPDASVYLLEVNPAMAVHAQNHRVPADRIVITDVTAMSARSASVDHMFSHSVVWALPYPETFFVEAQRVLRAGRTLAVSTVGEHLHVYRQFFLNYLERYLSAAVQRGIVSSERKVTFLQENARITEVAKSPLSRKQLVALGREHGFVVEVEADCYVIDTPQGAQPYFHQVLYRKT